MSVRFHPPLVFWLLLVAGVTSVAWTPYKTKASSCSLRWYGQAAPDGSDPGAKATSRTVEVQVDQAGLSTVAATALQSQVGLALNAWNGVLCPESGSPVKPLPTTLQLGPLGAPSPVGAACTATGIDGTCQQKATNGNFVRVITKASDWPYGSGVFALTVLTYNTCSGEIVDGDILLDDATHKFCVTGCNLSTQHLLNTLTHEVGHLLGMDHSDLPQATMYYSAPAGEVQKITLHGDDVQGICQTYQGGCGKNYACGKAATAGSSDADGGCDAGVGAGAGTAGTGWASAALGGALIAALMQRRRRGNSEIQH